MIEQDESGRFLHTFRQSDVKTLDTCPARWDYEHNVFALEDVWESDAAAAGSAVHAGIEARLNGQVYNLDDMIGVMEWDFKERTALQNFRRIKWKSDNPPLNFARICLGHWEGQNNNYRWDERVVDVEWHFDVPFYEDAERVIRLSGTADLYDIDGTLWDWKTSGRGEYEEWEYKRWAAQPTVYTAAKTIDSGTPHNDFTYGVMHRHGMQVFSVTRDERDWAFLERKVVSYAKMAEAAIFPEQDNHALCSIKWCQAYPICKGAVA